MSVQIVARGDRVTCSKTRKFIAVHESAEFNAWLSINAVSFVYADRSTTPGEYAGWRQRIGAPGDFPSVAVLVDGKMMGKFCAAGYSATKLIAKIETYCGSCFGGATVPPVAPSVPGVCPTCKGKRSAKCPTCGTTKTCWTCKGKGKVACVTC